MNIKFSVICCVLFLLCADASSPNYGHGREIKRRGRLRHGQHNLTQVFTFHYSDKIAIF